MTDIRIVATWAALSCCVMVIGHMVGSERISGIGAVMAIFTAAFVY